MFNIVSSTKNSYFVAENIDVNQSATNKNTNNKYKYIKLC